MTGQHPLDRGGLLRHTERWAQLQRRRAGAPIDLDAYRAYAEGDYAVWANAYVEGLYASLADFRERLAALGWEAEVTAMLSDLEGAVGLATFHLLQRHALAAAEFSITQRAAGDVGRLDHDLDAIRVGLAVDALHLSETAAALSAATSDPGLPFWTGMYAMPLMLELGEALVAIDLYLALLDLTPAGGHLVALPVAYPSVPRDGAVDPHDVLFAHLPDGRDLIVRTVANEEDLDTDDVFAPDDEPARILASTLYDPLPEVGGALALHQLVSTPYAEGLHAGVDALTYADLQARAAELLPPEWRAPHEDYRSARQARLFDPVLRGLPYPVLEEIGYV